MIRPRVVKKEKNLAEREIVRVVYKQFASKF
jgi:hypothetical protein